MGILDIISLLCNLLQNASGLVVLGANNVFLTCNHYCLGSIPGSLHRLDSAEEVPGSRSAGGHVRVTIRSDSGLLLLPGRGRFVIM